MEKMSKMEQIYQFLKENPEATYKDICYTLGIEYDTARRAVYVLRKRGDLTKENKAMREEKLSKIELKQEIVLEMIESYLEDFRKLDFDKDKLSLGRLILELVEKY